MHAKTILAAIMVFAAAQAAVTKDCTTTVTDDFCSGLPSAKMKTKTKYERIDCKNCAITTFHAECTSWRAQKDHKLTRTRTSCKSSHGTLAERAPTTSTMTITKGHAQIASPTSTIMTITLENALTITKDHAQVASPTCTTTLQDRQSSPCNLKAVATATSFLDCEDCALEVLPVTANCVLGNCGFLPCSDWTTTVTACHPSTTPPVKTLAVRATTSSTTTSRTTTETDDCPALKTPELCEQPNFGQPMSTKTEEVDCLGCPNLIVEPKTCPYGDRDVTTTYVCARSPTTTGSHATSTASTT